MFVCEFVCLCYVRPVCAFELGVCKYVLTGCLFVFVSVCECMCVRVCADTRQHSQALDGTPIHTLVLGALPVHMSERFQK